MAHLPSPMSYSGQGSRGPAHVNFRDLAVDIIDIMLVWIVFFERWIFFRYQVLHIVDNLFFEIKYWDPVLLLLLLLYFRSELSHCSAFSIVEIWVVLFSKEYILTWRCCCLLRNCCCFCCCCCCCCCWWWWWWFRCCCCCSCGCSFCYFSCFCCCKQTLWVLFDLI